MKRLIHCKRITLTRYPRRLLHYYHHPHPPLHHPHPPPTPRQPYLSRAIGLHDTCGVHNLHGMPGILAAVAGIVAAGIADKDTYGLKLVLQPAA